MMRNNMHSRLHALLLIAILGFTAAACDSAEPDDDGAGEEELITRIVLTLTSGDDTYMFEASDPDGDGTDFQIGTLSLPADAVYSGTVEVYDDVNDENLTDEIREEDDEHQFFFETGGADASRLAVTVDDTDENGLPVGLEYTLTVSAGEPGEATLRVILSHYDDEPKDGVNRSDETDVDVTFPVSIL
ncbi:MAG: type 1 periplasmic binding fold superfamily protein [Rhodothermales bacterium]|nr:type 1 periplasmic binding fold superfamily protein [Rhodothermales bacterium]